MALPNEIRALKDIRNKQKGYKASQYYIKGKRVTAKPLNEFDIYDAIK